MVMMVMVVVLNLLMMVVMVVVMDAWMGQFDIELDILEHAPALGIRTPGRSLVPCLEQGEGVRNRLQQFRV
jgi:hypothetical protein